MYLMRHERAVRAVQYHAAHPGAGRSGLQTQLEWIAALPASREAERLLALPDIGMTNRDPLLPALLTLLQWALEDDMSGLDKSRARAAWEELMQLELRGEPRAAVLALLSCGNPEHEVPAELLGRNADEAAAGIVALAAALSQRLSRPGRRRSAGARL